VLPEPISLERRGDCPVVPFSTSPHLLVMASPGRTLDLEGGEPVAAGLAYCSVHGLSVAIEQGERSLEHEPAAVHRDRDDQLDPGPARVMVRANERPRHQPRVFVVAGARFIDPCAGL
jgi:hypothetical protein